MIFVAEIGSNHKGIKSLAYEMIRLFSQAGATICKFQLGHPESDFWDVRYAPMEWVDDLARWCDDFGVEFMASIWSPEGLDAARSVDMKRYKYASRKAFKSHTNLDYDVFLSELISDGKEIFISDNRVQVAGLLRWLYCVPEYPQYPPIEMPLEFLDNQWYGYSSHVHGIADALIAISRGAQLVEKHVTLDKTEESIKDNAFAISPREFANLVQLGKEIHRLI